ncbi:MAG TPA: class I SAM-dependent methyltransferase [Pseudomonadales bacterium]|nr:class I SAM-dependent methyltransferase [Pseudomonadales bacterium]
MERIEYQLMNTLEQDFWWYRALHATVTARLLQLALPAGSAVLDAGCGTGGLLRYLVTHAPHLRFSGLEFDSEAAAMAEQKTGMPITRGSVNAMPFADASFAAILSQDVLYHRNVDDQAMVRECYRCLQPGGHVLLHVAAFQWMASAHDAHVHGARRYNAQQLRSLMQQNGFRVVKTAYWNSLLFPLMALQRLTVGKHKTSSDVQAPPAWQNHLFFQVLDLERRLRLQLPYGGSVWAWGTKP